MNYTTCYSECLIMALHYAPVYSKIKNYYFFFFPEGYSFFLFDVKLMADVSIAFLFKSIGS